MSFGSAVGQNSSDGAPSRRDNFDEILSEAKRIWDNHVCKIILWITSLDVRDKLSRVIFRIEDTVWHVGSGPRLRWPSLVLVPTPSSKRGARPACNCAMARPVAPNEPVFVPKPWVWLVIIAP